MKKLLHIFNTLWISAILLCVLSAHGMHPTSSFTKVSEDRSLCELRSTGLEKNPSPITFAQTYHYFAYDIFLSEIAQHIFSFQLDYVNFVELSSKIKQNLHSPNDLIRYIESLISLYGYMLTSEICEYYFKKDKISICFIRNKEGCTCLHLTENPKVTRILLRIAGNNKDKLLMIQDNTYLLTALHHKAFFNNIQIAELLLDAAGNNKNTLLAMRSNKNETALHIAACRNTKEEMVKLLLDAAGDNVQDFIMMKNDDGRTAFNVSNSSKIKKIIQTYYVQTYPEPDLEKPEKYKKTTKKNNCLIS